MADVTLKITLPPDIRRENAKAMIKIAADAIRNTGAVVTQNPGDTLALSDDPQPSEERMRALRELYGVTNSEAPGLALSDSAEGASDARMKELRKVYGIA